MFSANFYGAVTHTYRFLACIESIVYCGYGIDIYQYRRVFSWLWDEPVSHPFWVSVFYRPAGVRENVRSRGRLET